MIDAEYIVPKQKSLPDKIKDDPLGQPSISMIVGSTGSGKSTTMANLLVALQKRHDFDTGLFVTGNNRDPLLDAIELPITTSPKDFEDYITEVKQAKEGTKHILIMDDLQSSKDFNLMLGRSIFTNFVLSHRHYGQSAKEPGKHGVWIIMTAQTLKNSFTPVIRDQVKSWFLYYPRKPTDVKIYQDIAQDPVKMERAMRLVRNQGKYTFLFLNKHDIENDRYFLGFKDELVDL